MAWMGTYDKTDLYHRKTPQADVVPSTPPRSPPRRSFDCFHFTKEINDGLCLVLCALR